MLFTVVIFLVAIHLTNPLCAQQFKLDGHRKKASVNFISIKNLIIIPVMINGKGPYNFLLDTGVGQMIITDTTFLKDLDPKYLKNIQVQGYGFGREINAVLTRDITARVGSSSIDHIFTAIFKEDIFDLSSYLGIKIYGILGYQFFSSFVVRVNYATKRITFYDPLTVVKKKGIRIPLKIINAKPYMNAEITTDSAKKISVELLIDNGSSHPLMLETMNSQPFPLPPVTIPANLGVGINGQISGHMGRIPTLKIGDFTFNSVLSGFPDYNQQRTDLEGSLRNGSLGAEVLRHFLVTFDYPGESMYLKQTNKFKKRFEHDMSGIEIYVHSNPKERYYISRVEPGSPAEQIGLQENDEIIAINFSPAQGYSLNDLNELLMEQNGKQILLEIARKGEIRVVLLKLKRRI